MLAGISPLAAQWANAARAGGPIGLSNKRPERGLRVLPLAAEASKGCYIGIARGDPGSGRRVRRHALGAPRETFAVRGRCGPGQNHSWGAALHAAAGVGRSDRVGARARFPAAAPSEEPQGMLSADKGAGGGEQGPLASVGGEPSAVGRSGEEPLF